MNPARFRSMTRCLIRRAGGGLNVTLRRSSTLRIQRTGDATTALVVAAAALAGATSISLRADHLSGELIAGSTLTIAGHASPYTTAEDVRATKDGVLENVALTSALTAPAAEDDVVTLTSTVVDAAYEAMQSREDVETVSATINGLTRVLHLAVVPGRRKPRENDLLVAAAGAFERNERVAHVQALEPHPGQPVRWTVWITTQTGATS